VGVAVEDAVDQSWRDDEADNAAGDRRPARRRQVGHLGGSSSLHALLGEYTAAGVLLDHVRDVEAVVALEDGAEKLLVCGLAPVVELGAERVAELGQEALGVVLDELGDVG
jgi:hypothetical protein